MKNSKKIIAILLIATMSFAVLTSCNRSVNDSGNVEQSVSALTMPDVVGKTQAEAVQLLKDSGLNSSVISNPNDEYEAGIVYSQSVAAGTSVSSGAVVLLHVSSGKKAPAETTAPTEPDYTDNSVQWKGMTAEQIVAKLTLEQKAAQMMQGDIKVMKYDEMMDECYGSVLSIFDEFPQADKTTWIGRVREYQLNALSSETGIPYIYGQDSVHGLYGVRDSLVYPHNINAGAANDPELMYEYGKVVASDMKHVGTILNFGPCVASSQDPRWGRTYESMSSDLDRVDALALQYAKGQLDEGVIICPKHFFGDGFVAWGTGEDDKLIDRGDATLDEKQIARQMETYKKLSDVGAQVIMITHSAVNGVKMHENKDLILRFKEESGFKGFILSDWESIHNCSGATLYDQVVDAINAGIDMLMEPNKYKECYQYIIDAVGKGDITMERVDDAVTRIIRVKLEAGIFDDPMLENTNPSYDFNSDHGRELARKLAAESFVPLKLGKNYQIKPGMKVFVTGPAANDTGVMCGGWTMLWQGMSDAESGARWDSCGVTILDALTAMAAEKGFTIVTDPSQISTCDMVLLCIGEKPYAEWNGDTEDLSITGALALSGNKTAIETAAKSGIPTTALLVCGRNVIIKDYLDQWDSCIMCYLPGSEGGNAVADVLCGDAKFKGTLPMPYYESVDQIGTGKCWHDVGWSAAK